MSWKTVRIRALDSLLFRDGRPFAAEPGALTARGEPIRYLTIAGRTTAWVPSVQR